jgi:2,3-dihydroxybiphenyl 1,2-dioxygenase
MQAAERTDDRLLLRVDERAYRLDVRRGDSDTLDVIGWELAAPEDLDEFAGKLEEAGYSVKRADDQALRERQVSGLLSFTDRAGVTVELAYGMANDHRPFVSPTGARFTTGDQGIGHINQFVSDTAAHRELYMDILGFKLTGFMDVGPVGVFLHCNPRNHSLAFAALPGVKPGIGHLMLEVDDMDVVGRAYDKVLGGAAELRVTLGKHTNDKMLSFYMKSPSNFEIEYGWNGMRIDDATYIPDRWYAPNLWGHQRLANAMPDI